MEEIEFVVLCLGLASLFTCVIMSSFYLLLIRPIDKDMEKMGKKMLQWKRNSEMEAKKQQHKLMIETRKQLHHMGE